MSWELAEAEVEPDRDNQPDPDYDFKTSGHIERTILQQLTSWDNFTDTFQPSWSEGKPTSWLFPAVAVANDPSVKVPLSNRGTFDPDESLEASVRRALSRLHDRGLLSRTKDPDDGRVVRWNVTDEGVREAAMIADGYAREFMKLNKRYGVIADICDVSGSADWGQYYLARMVEDDE